MPLYTYLCRSCSARFDERRPVDERDAVARCPHCDEGATRVQTTAGFVVNGFNAKNRYSNSRRSE